MPSTPKLNWQYTPTDIAGVVGLYESMKPFLEVVRDGATQLARFADRSNYSGTESDKILENTLMAATGMGFLVMGARLSSGAKKDPGYFRRKELAEYHAKYHDKLRKPSGLWGAWETGHSFVIRDVFHLPKLLGERAFMYAPPDQEKVEMRLESGKTYTYIQVKDGSWVKWDSEIFTVTPEGEVSHKGEKLERVRIYPVGAITDITATFKADRICPEPEKWLPRIEVKAVTSEATTGIELGNLVANDGKTASKDATKKYLMLCYRPFETSKYSAEVQNEIFGVATAGGALQSYLSLITEIGDQALHPVGAYRKWIHDARENLLSLRKDGKNLQYELCFGHLMDMMRPSFAPAPQDKPFPPGKYCAGYKSFLNFFGLLPNDSDPLLGIKPEDLRPVDCTAIVAMSIKAIEYTVYNMMSMISQKHEKSSLCREYLNDIVTALSPNQTNTGILIADLVASIGSTDFKTKLDKVETAIGEMKITQSTLSSGSPEQIDYNQRLIKSILTDIESKTNLANIKQTCASVIKAPSLVTTGGNKEILKELLPTLPSLKAVGEIIHRASRSLSARNPEANPNIGLDLLSRHINTEVTHTGSPHTRVSVNIHSVAR